MNDSTSIKTIHVKNYDDKRSFDGIKILKIDKKDRHNQRLDKFAKFLDDTNEALTQRFLQLLRQNRESLEVIDENIQKHYHNLASDIFLLGHTEESLSLLLKDIKEVVAGRLLVIEQFSSGLEKIEADRAEIISAELKRLVDELVSIAHKLRDDIEHIVEAETYELNVEIIKNKAKNATLVGEFRVAQVKIDIESEKLWRNGKARWRQLMHDKALQEFLSEISSTAFTDPTDRREFLKSVQNGQLLRKRRVEEQLALLRQFTATSITSDEVSKVQNQFTAINMEEVDAIQDCYNGMLLLGETLNQRIQSRVDILRKDLHYYGALKLAPPLEEVAAELDSIVNETSLQEFFAACGGIKVDINFIAEELRSGKMIYDRNIDSILEKFEFLAVCCSMNQHFEKRKGAVEDVTSLLVKIKSCTKNEIPNTIRPLLTLLDQFADDPSLPTIFVNALLDIRKEITVELQKYEASAANLTFNPENSTKGTIKSASTKRLSSTGKSRKGERSIFFTTIDVNCLKVWSRRLGSLFLAINLPDQYKERLQSMSKIVSKQKTCNQLVEETIRSNSYEDIRLLDWKHRKLSESIATYLEVQASQISLVATNIIDFFYKVAKFTAVEKAHQTSLTDKYEDEVWDLAEDFRFEKEDKEALFDAECQKIRESIMQEELQTCFESVLQVLDEIQESYRNYHKKACFVVDKYPLVLVDSYCESLSKMRELFFIQARSNHPLLMEYQRIFDENIRLNKEFYEQNENPTGIEKRSCDAFFDPRVDKDDSLEGFDSPLLKSLSGISLTSYKGSYRILESTAHICEKFEKESFFAVPEENADNSTKDELELHLFTAAKRNLHVDHAWLSADFVLSIADKGKYDTMNEVDRDIYDTALVKNFVDLDDDNIELLSPDEKELYNFHVTLVKKLKQNARLFKDPSHVLENVPKDLSGNQWVVEVRIGPKQVQELYESIRNSCITQLETDSCTRIHVGEKLSMTRKADYTDNLEDQLRNHWPRRGRVETEIKQPREAELLSHKEKTWRHIQSIQQKVIDLQQLFTDGLTDGRKECDSYVVHMTALRTSLNNETFKNLATLQGVDVRARTSSLEFRALCSARIKSLQNLSEASVASILSYARDFRKICPLQAPGVEGGYSEAEINAIDDMVEGQCREILEISTSWQAEVTKFKEEQVQSSKCYDEFIDKYEKVTQDLAMSEGLGQKYGAPRRRAQEQIRTELSRDEQKAGKIDELLATLEFVCAEFKRNDGTASDERTVATKLTSPSNPEDSTSEEANFDLLCESLKTANQAWELMCSVRRMLLQRVSYLKVADKMELLHLPWLNKTRISELLQSKNTETEEDDEIIESYDGRTLQEVIESIDSKCRLETRELYKTEGKLDMLSDGSVPLSLQQWLSESQEKVVGRGGYREKAWKKLWLQVERSEILFQRHQNLEHVEVVPRKIGFPALCLRSISEAFLVHAKLDQIERESSFRKLMNIWQKGREKHERLLRPRLGSPDVVEELNDLNNVELQRSSELVENVTKFRTLLIRTQVKLLKRFYEDLGTCSKGLVLMLDTTYRQEQIQIPPDTDIPKKHMTLKKLRKAQRIKEEVALGMSDRSKQRTWPAINMQRTLEVVRAVEDLVSDLGSLDEDTPPKNDSNTDKKSKTKAVKAATDENDSETASLLLSAWMNNLRELSEVNSLVSSAHRIIITERDEAVDRYVTCIDSLFKHLREKYDAVLKQERSWNERWRRQVQMLRDGNL